MQLDGTLGFLGFGNMGGAILKGLLDSAVTAPGQVHVFDVDADKCAAAKAVGVNVAPSPEALAAAVDMLVLAVKPQTMADALAQVKLSLKPSTLIISIAAGISIGFIRNGLGHNVRVARVMPNTPALVLEGAAGVALSENCTEADAAAARTIFESVGVVEMVDESMIDVVTALSGSGPAYFFHMVEALVAAAVAHGLDEQQALRLATQTVLGAGRLLSESGEPPAVLRQRVTSKGGTTEAALNAFAANDFESIVAEAVSAAVARAHELGK